MSPATDKFSSHGAFSQVRLHLGYIELVSLYKNRAVISIKPETPKHHGEIPRVSKSTPGGDESE